MVPSALAPAPWPLLAVVSLQGYHVVEHVVKLIQHYHGAAMPLGTLGRFVPVIWLHFWVNLVVLVLIAAGWFVLRGNAARPIPRTAQTTPTAAPA